MRRGAVQRILHATSRVEGQPFDFNPGQRLPRFLAASGYLCCQLGGTLAPASGTWPNLTPGSGTNQQIYRASQNPSTSAYSLTAVGTANATILNYSATSFAPAKVTIVIPCGLPNTYVAVNQDC